MMELFSPLARRVIALGLLVLFLLVSIGWIILPLLQASRAAIGELADVREALARAEAIKMGPTPRQIVPFPDRAIIYAADVQSARQRLAGYVTSKAVARNLQLAVRGGPTTKSAMRAPTSISLDIVLFGPRDNLLKWISEVERGAPAVRMRNWKLAAVGTQLPATPVAPPVQSAQQEGVDQNPSDPERTLRLEATIVALWAGSR